MGQEASHLLVPVTQVALQDGRSPRATAACSCAPSCPARSHVSTSQRRIPAGGIDLQRFVILCRCLAFLSLSICSASRTPSHSFF